MIIEKNNIFINILYIVDFYINYNISKMKLIEKYSKNKLKRINTRFSI
jgi:hypothetical protein